MSAATNPIEFGTDVPTTALYRIYDAADALLYIGISDNPAGRIAQHRAQKSWFADAARTTVTWYATRAEALSAEAAAIGAESPRHNIAGTSRERERRERPAPAGPTLLDCRGTEADRIGLRMTAELLRNFAARVTEFAESEAAEFERLADWSEGKAPSIRGSAA